MVFGLLLFALLGKDPVAGLRVFLIEPLVSKRAIGEVAQDRAAGAVRAGLVGLLPRQRVEQDARRGS